MQKVTGQYAPEYGNVSYPWYALRYIQCAAYGSWGWSYPHRDVMNAMELARPHDLHKLALEVPKPAFCGAQARVSYYRSRADQVAGKRTETSLGKYLRRHWGGILPDHYFRDCAMQYSTEGMRVLTDMEAIVEAVRTGPYSCMARAHAQPHLHPYRAYRPDLGWGLLIKEVAGKVVARALLLTRDGKRHMVRAYGVVEAVHAWAQQNGVEMSYDWPVGARIAYNPELDGAPYVDGCAAAELVGDEWRLLGFDYDQVEHGDEYYDLSNPDTTEDLYYPE